MGYKFQKWEIPDYMMPAINRYVNEHIKPGDFLTAVVRNDLREAVGYADSININNLPAFIGYFYNEAPAMCWGSKEKVERWLKHDPEEVK